MLVAAALWPGSQMVRVCMYLHKVGNWSVGYCVAARKKHSDMVSLKSDDDE